MKVYIFILLVVTTFLYSCQDVIPVKLDEGTSQLSVDAFIDNEAGAQHIRLTKTAGYFNNAPANPATGAIIKISDKAGRIYNFVDIANTGNYSWTPSANDTLIRLFNSYTLSVLYEGETFQASSVVFPTTEIDSVTYIKRKVVAGPDAGKERYATSFYATDIAGMPNFYWIKSYKNGVFYSKPANMNLSQDGAFPGGGTDGLMFILPIREGITSGDTTLAVQDSIVVRLCSLNPETYFYLNEVITQTTNSGLFATPPSNVSTNIKNTNKNSKTKAVGWFNVGLMSVKGVRIK